MSDPTRRTDGDTTPAGFPPAPPEAHQGAGASEDHGKQTAEGGSSENGQGEEQQRFLGTATYSPEDNKLRLYPFARLSRPDYERVKSAGFTWAPKQQLFVTPMWTPARAALLVALCGEIEDEDRTLLERAGERAERFEDYSERRGQEGDAARRQVEAIAEHIPFGQPILIGHHSERRARKDAQRIQDGMRRAVKLWDTRDYWERRAQAAKAHAEYRQVPAVRYRRIKGLEADLRKSHKIMQEAQAFLALWQAADLTHAQAVAIANRDSVNIVETGQTFGTSAYAMLTRAQPRPLAEVVALAVRFHETRIARQTPWIAHHEHRIAYERAMLEEDGGLVAEGVEMAPGGRVRVGEQWFTIERVNKKDGRAVSVTISGRFVPVWGIEKIREYKPPTEDEAARLKSAKKLPPLANYPHEGAVEMTSTQWKRTHSDYKGTREAGQGARSEGAARLALKNADAASHGLHRVRVVVQQGALRSVFITDAKVVRAPSSRNPKDSEDAKDNPEPRGVVPALAPGPVPGPVPVPQSVTGMGSAAPASPAAAEAPPAGPEGAASIEAMRRTLRAGGVRVVSVPQIFPTPTDLAKRMVAIAAPRVGERVLEPSAGSGNLLRALPGVVPFAAMKQTACEVVAVERNMAFKESLVNEGLAQRVVGGDFLACTPEDLGRFDVILMNPPFANAADIAHIQHARQFLAPGGRLVAICADGPRQRQCLRALGSYEPLPEDSFASVGTNVRTALVVVRV